MLCLSVIVTTLSMSVSPAVAQGAPKATRIPATVAVAAEQVSGKPYRLLRRAGEESRDVIFLSPTATADDLSDAIGDLLAIRRVQGDTARSTGLVRVRHAQTARPHPRRYPWAARVFADVRTATPENIPGVGRFRALTIWLPPQGRDDVSQQ